jgi:hypothetical protein
MLRVIQRWYAFHFPKIEHMPRIPQTLALPSQNRSIIADSQSLRALVIITIIKRESERDEGSGGQKWIYWLSVRQFWDLVFVLQPFQKLSLLKLPSSMYSKSSVLFVFYYFFPNEKKLISTKLFKSSKYFCNHY